MNRKLGVFMLSLAVFMLSVLPAFAITADDFSSMVVDDTDLIYTDNFTEGYNYRQRVYVDTEGLEETLGPVSWEVYPAYDWLNWYIGSDDKNIIIEGRLPAYKESDNYDDNTYPLHVVAYVSGDVLVTDANGDPEYDADGNEKYVSGNISADVGYGDGLQITVDQSYDWVNQFTNFLSYDAKAINVARIDDYTVRITFKESVDLVPDYEYDHDEDSDTYSIREDDNGNYIKKSDNLKDGSTHIMLQLEYDPEYAEWFGDNFNLPTWLGYRVISWDTERVYDVDTNEWDNGYTSYVKELEIFYSSDREVAVELPASVRITANGFSYEYREYIDPEGTNESYDLTPVIGWDLTYVPIPKIALDQTAATIAVNYDSSADLTVNYVDQEVASSDGVIFSPDISGHVLLDVEVIPANTSDTVSGKIVITATPKTPADAVYSTDMIVTDAEGSTATMSLTISVDLPSIKLSADYVYLSSLYNDSDEVSIAYTPPQSLIFSLPTLPEDLNFTVDKEANTITFSIKPVNISGDWEETLTISNKYNKSANITLKLKVFASGDVGLDIVSGDVPSSGITIVKGDTASYTIAPKKATSLSWDISGDGANFLTVVSSDNNITLTVNTESSNVGTYTVTVNAKDSSGTRVGSYTFTWTVEPCIILSGDTSVISVKYPSSASIDVIYASQDIAAKDGVIFSPDISGNVSLDFVVTPANTSDDFGGKITITATPLTLADAVYSTDLIVTGINGGEARMTLTISVDVPSIVISGDNPLSLSAQYLASYEDTVSYSGPKPIGYTLSPDVPSDFGLTITSDDEAKTITIAIAPTISADWNGTLTINDEYGKSADIALSLRGYVTGNISINYPSAISGGVTTLEGESATYVLSAVNAYRTVTWDVSGNYPEGSVTWSLVNGALNLVIDALEGYAGSYDVTVTAKDESERTAGSYTFTWTVDPHIALSYDSDTISVDFGASADLTVKYLNKVPVSIVFSPDISADVTLSAVSADATTSSDTISGTITITATPIAQYIALYSTDMIVTDTVGKTAKMTLYVSVDMDAISMDKLSDTVIVEAGNSADVSFAVSNNSGVVSWDVGTLPSGLTVEQASDGAYATEYNSVMNYTVTAASTLATSTYSVDITATDEAGRSTSAVLYIGVVSGEVSVTVSGNDPDKLVIGTGSSQTFTLTAGNTYGTTTWAVSGTYPDGAISLDNETGDTLSFVINAVGIAAGKYNATITATDESGRTKRYEFSWTVRQYLLLSPDYEAISVDLGSSADASIEYFYQEPDLVSFDNDDISSDVAISYKIISDDYSDGTPHGTIVINFTPITPLEASYSTIMTVTDKDGYDEATVFDVDVNVGSLDITPDSTDVAFMVGSSADVTFSVSIFSGTISWDYGTIPTGLTVTEGNGTNYANAYNSVVAYTITGTIPGTYSFSVTATDSRGETATAEVRVTVMARPPLPPVIEISPDVASLSVAVGESDNVSFTADPYSGDVTWTLGTVPEGITVEPATDVLYATEHNNVMIYTVTGVTVGTYSVDVVASDDSGARHATIEATVTEPGALAIAQPTVTATITAGTSRDVSFTVNNNIGAVTWTLGAIPTGITVTPATQTGTTASYTVTVASTVTAGNYTVPVTAIDSIGRTANGTISITVTAASTFAIAQPTASATIAAGASRDVSFTVNNNIGAVTWTLGTIPTGITVTPSTQTGTRASYTVTVASNVTPNNYSVPVTATDSIGRTANGTISITVTAASTFAIAQPTASATIAAGASRDVSFTVNNNIGAVTWTLGTIPTGITVTPSTQTGTTASYTVTVASTVTPNSYSVSVTATDSAGRTANGTISITVTAPSTFALSPSTATASVVRGGSSASVSFTASGYTGSVTWTAGTTPAGITVTSNGSGTFTVAAASSVTAGSYNVTVTATDTAGRTATGTIRITVTAPIGTLSVSPSATSVATVAGGTSGSISLVAVNNSGSVTWSVGSTPTGVTVTSLGGGNFLVTANSSASSGSYTVTITAADSAGRTATARITISVEAQVAGNTEPGDWTDATIERVSRLIGEEILTEDGEIKSDAINYGSSSTSAKALSQTGTTEVKQGENINPVKLTLDFPVDIWRIYMNGELVAWAYSPGVSGGEYVADSEFSASARSTNGVTIDPKPSKTEADVTFETSEMPAGNNEIETAFVENVNEPDQEIGRTTLATVEVAVDDSVTPTPATSGDNIPGVGAAGGGCSAGLGAMVSALAAAFFISKKRS